MTTHMFLTQYNSQTAGFKQIGLGEEQLFPSSAKKTVYFFKTTQFDLTKIRLRNKMKLFQRGVPN